jgi:hypothetical protein
MRPSLAKSISEPSAAPAASSTGVLLQGGSLQLISGDPFPALSPDDITALCADRTTIRQVDQHLLISTPFGAGRSMLLAYPDLPDGMTSADLARHVESKSAASAKALATAAAGPNPAAAPDLPDSFVAAITASIPFRPKRRLEGFARELTNTGFSRHVVAAKIRRGKARGLTFSRPDLKNAKTEIRFLLKSCLNQNASPDSPLENPPENPQENPLDSLDADLLAEKMGGRKLSVFLPDAPSGIAILATDVSARDLATIKTNMPLLDLLTPAKKWARRMQRAAAWGAGTLALLGLIAYMALPAPVHIRGAALSTSGDTKTIALPFPAFLDISLVRPGELVSAGDPIMKLRSPDLEQALAEEKLTQNLEELNAQEALEQNDFNSFQLAQSRQNLSAQRLDQLQHRVSLLDVRASTDARVLSVLPNTISGGFLNTGTELARLQPTQIFEAQIDVNPVDAARLSAGQSGELFFKGLPGQVFAIETMGVPVLGPAPDGQSQTLTIEAKVLDADQSALIPGLSGYAKIYTGDAPRFFSVFRKVSDYVRFNIWKLLGFDI